MKILNLYAGIGGNRKLWGDEHEITAIENNEEIANIYQHIFPNDKVIITDAHQYLLEHFKEFDFIWSSPPCPSHSRFQHLKQNFEETIKKYPNMELYEEIIYLKHFFKGRWVVENVISYYEPLIKPQVCDSHYYWSNFIIPFIKNTKRGVRGQDFEYLEKEIGFDFKGINIPKRFYEKIIRNCVKPESGLYIFKCAFKEQQQTI